MMNLLLYVESRQTIARLRAEAGSAPAGRPSPLAYPDDLYEDSPPDSGRDAAPARGDRFEWPLTPSTPQTALTAQTALTPRTALTAQTALTPRTALAY